VYTAVVLVEALAKNVGLDFLLHAATVGMPEALGKAIRAASAVAKSGVRGSSIHRDALEQGLELVQNLGEECLPLRVMSPALGGYVAVYHALKAEGLLFPEYESTRPKILDLTGEAKGKEEGARPPSTAAGGSASPPAPFKRLEELIRIAPPAPPALPAGAPSAPSCKPCSR
jgi:hypothetical protein